MTVRSVDGALLGVRVRVRVRVRRVDSLTSPQRSQNMKTRGQSYQFRAVGNRNAGVLTVPSVDGALIRFGRPLGRRAQSDFDQTWRVDSLTSRQRSQKIKTGGQSVKFRALGDRNADALTVPSVDGALLINSERARTDDQEVRAVEWKFSVCPGRGNVDDDRGRRVRRLSHGRGSTARSGVETGQRRERLSSLFGTAR